MKTETKSQNALAKQPADETLLPTFFREGWPYEEWFRPLFPDGGHPRSLLRRMEESASRLLGHSALPLPTAPALPRMDISEDDKEWLVEAEIPGVRPDDITVELRDGVLYMNAQSNQETTEEKPENNGKRRYYRKECRSSYVERAFSIPDGVDEEKITSEYKDGILRCHLPKKPGATTPSRKIPVGKS